MKIKHDETAEDYYQAMLDLQQRCEDDGVNFRAVLTGLITDWLNNKERHDEARSSQRDA